MPYTLGTAAKATGKSKPTISKAIESGKISARRLENGSYEIDPAELHRVFPPLPLSSKDTGKDLPLETTMPDSGLHVEVKMLREMLAKSDGVIDDLRVRLDLEAEERRKLTRLLTDQSARPAPQAASEAPRRSWWLFSRSND